MQTTAKGVLELPDGTKTPVEIPMFDFDGGGLFGLSEAQDHATTSCAA